MEDIKECGFVVENSTNNYANVAEALEKELVKEGEKLSDLLSIPVKDAFGRELPVNYQEDIINVREILEMTIARRQLFKDSVELQRLTLQQIIHIRNYENNSMQVNNAHILQYFVKTEKCLFLEFNMK